MPGRVVTMSALMKKVGEMGNKQKENRSFSHLIGRYVIFKKRCSDTKRILRSLLSSLSQWAESDCLAYSTDNLLGYPIFHFCFLTAFILSLYFKFVIFFFRTCSCFLYNYFYSILLALAVPLSLILIFFLVIPVDFYLFHCK